MAKIVETIFIVKLSQLVKDSQAADVPGEWDSLPGTLEQVVHELVSKEVVVEVERA
jgi:hypothetical protein